MFPSVLSVTLHGDVTVMQIGTDPQNTAEYISGPSAIRKKLISVKEVSESGSVNNLIVLNPSPNYIFFTDMDMLEGAKQNRVLNTSVFLAPDTKTTIPVSCVERGRWNRSSIYFDASDNPLPYEIRGQKMKSVVDSMKTKKSYMANQSEVWDNVSHYLHKEDVISHTENVGEAITKSMHEKRSKFAEINPYEGANGVAVFFKGKLKSLDIFNRPDIYQEYLPKITSGIFLSLDPEEKQKDYDTDKLKYELLDTIDTFIKSDAEVIPAIGCGEQKSFENKSLRGYMLTHNNSIIHLTMVGRI